ncbi:bifunctional hydroxymethylpyrimidine kinase/phosphomethylpyrimidine kinase [Cribrihabitans neustonicus]|uniref:bifunctional hydroxymethylpyrimidine kinase/phosphomethylpyrimidine kinase n=1 Tax=Cribrihabitans neustonicus TaxID=1429085 RepID=UPI003B58D8DA
MTAILAAGGTDSSGGAGLTRDAAMAAALDVSLRPVVTAVTAQTDCAVEAVYPAAPEEVAAQALAALATAPGPRAVKTGMIGSPALAAALAAVLPLEIPLVLDPVLKASSGGDLMPADGFNGLLQRAALITPNLPELAELSGRGGSMEAQVETLLAEGVQAILVKGGHGAGRDSTDHLFTASGEEHVFAAPRLAVSRRGTGCSLATAIACHLAKGETLAEACRAAKSAVRRWLAG